MCLSTMWSDTFTAVDLLFSALSSHSQRVTPEQPAPLAPLAHVDWHWFLIHLSFIAFAVCALATCDVMWCQLSDIRDSPSLCLSIFIFIWLLIIKLPKAETLCFYSFISQPDHFHARKLGQLFPWNLQPHCMSASQVLNSSWNASLVAVWPKMKREQNAAKQTSSEQDWYDWKFLKKASPLSFLFCFVLLLFIWERHLMKEWFQYKKSLCCFSQRGTSFV